MDQVNARYTPHAVAILVLLWAALLTPAQEISAASDPLQSKSASKLPFDLDVHGFLLGVVSGRTTGERPPGADDLTLGEERLRFDLSASPESGQPLVIVKGDLFHDAVANRLDDDLREAYVRYTKGSLDLSLGRQIVTWGVGDLFFINDVFPKDWAAFFSGLPMEYLKLGVDGLRARYSSELVNGDFLVIPSFTPDNLPSPKRFSIFDPLSALPKHRETEPSSRLSNTELALRLYRQVWDFDASIYIYRGFWHEPSVRLDNLFSPTTATRFFPKLSVYGASAQRNLLDGVLSLEMAYYDSALPNSQYRFLVGYQRELWQDFIAGLQVYSQIRDHLSTDDFSLAVGYPRSEQFVSTRITQLLDYQNWKLSLFAAYSPIHRDYFIQPEVSYRMTDSLSAYLGTNIFGGPRRTFFGQLRSDTAFFAMRFDFSLLS